MEDTYGIISCIPVLVLMTGIIATRKTAEFFIVACLTGSVILYKEAFLTGWIGCIYQGMSDGTYQFLILVIFLFGAMITLFENSGSLMGFSATVSKVVNSRKKSLVAAWILGIIIFVDDYLNALCVSASCRSITDRYGVSREQLAYVVNSCGATVCVLLPITSWAAACVAVISEYGLGMSDYIRAIPFMLYPILAILCALLVSLGVIPLIGDMKKANKRVAAGGPNLPPDSSSTVINTEELKSSSMWFFIIPMLVMVAMMFITNMDMLVSIIVTLALMFVMYLVTKLMKIGEFFKHVITGIRSMAELGFLITLCFSLVQINTALGFTDYVIGLFTASVPVTLVPAVAFFCCAFLAFTTGMFWPLLVIVAPIFIPLAEMYGIPAYLVIAGMMSGTAFGSHNCFWSDAVLMTSSGTGVNPGTQVRAVLPYTLPCAVLAFILLTIYGMIAF